MTSLFLQALKPQVSLPVARFLLSVRTASQLFQLAAGRGLKDSRAR
jgi:hypothetical protein